eukprot:gnl/Dysnectes_brevis/1707_a1940_1847.p1 GENE.gnl/Dysnectes_brevis/1707_a1940_1847~~gnl/Dysnectes_brevis/1707_a1940_1847.p1  ORF type:complete len:314 (+),score=44.77 gnl/Dysnectes_brevis/1707_a1940_1847:112-1053(+)
MEPMSTLDNPRYIAKQLYDALKGKTILAGEASAVLLQYEGSELWPQIEYQFRAVSGIILPPYLAQKISAQDKSLMKLYNKPRDVYIYELICGSNMEARLEVLLTMSVEEIKNIQAKYYAQQKKHLYLEFPQTTISHRLLQITLANGRDWSPDSVTSVEADVEAIRKATKGSGYDPHVIVEVMGLSSPTHYRMIAEEYQKAYGKALDKLWQSELSGVDQYAVLLLHHWLINPARATAFVIRSSMVGLGTDEEKLYRSMFVYLQGGKEFGSAVYQQYCQMYGKGKDQLSKDIIGDTSGFLRGMMLYLVKKARDSL